MNITTGKYEINVLTFIKVLLFLIMWIIGLVLISKISPILSLFYIGLTFALILTSVRDI